MRKVEVSPEEGHFETIHHEEEGHYENGKLLEEEKGHYEEVVITPGWTENKYVVDKPAWTETVEHPEEGHWEEVVVQEAWDEEVTRIGTFCHNCGFEIHSIDEWIAHSEASNGQCMSYGNKRSNRNHPSRSCSRAAVESRQTSLDRNSRASRGRSL